MIAARTNYIHSRGAAELHPNSLNLQKVNFLAFDRACHLQTKWHLRNYPLKSGMLLSSGYDYTRNLQHSKGCLKLVHGKLPGASTPWAAQFTSSCNTGSRRSVLCEL